MSDKNYHFILFYLLLKTRCSATQLEPQSIGMINNVGALHVVEHRPTSVCTIKPEKAHTGLQYPWKYCGCVAGSTNVFMSVWRECSCVQLCILDFIEIQMYRGTACYLQYIRAILDKTKVGDSFFQRMDMAHNQILSSLLGPNLDYQLFSGGGWGLDVVQSVQLQLFPLQDYLLQENKIKKSQQSCVHRKYEKQSLHFTIACYFLLFKLWGSK